VDSYKVVINIDANFHLAYNSRVKAYETQQKPVRYGSNLDIDCCQMSGLSGGARNEIPGLCQPDKKMNGAIFLIDLFERGCVCRPHYMSRTSMHYRTAYTVLQPICHFNR